MQKVKAGGGWPAIKYTLAKAREAGGVRRLWKAMRSRNTCKTCALGMGGQRGGMVNESGHFPEFCKKSLQAMVADMQPAIPASFFEKTSISDIKNLSPRELESLGRLSQPVVYNRGSNHYTPISWEDAFDRIVSRLKFLSPEQTFFYFSGRSSNEAGFLLQLFARVYGTNNVNNCSFYCHQASGVGLSSAIGTGTATVVLEDLDRADLVFVIGANPASNHPRLLRTLMQIRRRGGKVIVVNPLREAGLVRFRVPSNPRSLLFGDEIASTYVQPHVGGDLAFLSGIGKSLIEKGGIESAFIEQHTTGYEDYRDSMQSLSWDSIERESGVSRREIEDVANQYAASEHAILSWAMGITHHENGTKNVQAIANLALLRAMIGKPGAGLMPIRGHSNVQGIGSMGVTPRLKKAIFDGIEADLGVNLPDSPGRDTMACMEGAADGSLKFGLCLGGNLYGSNPDSTFAEESLSNLDQLVYLSTTLNTGHGRGLARETLILPVLARDEEPESTTQESMFNFVRLSDGGPERFSGARSELSVISTLAKGTLGPGGPVDWTSWSRADTIRSAISRIVPGYEAISRIDETKKEFQIEGRTFHSPGFPLPGGRARFHAHDISHEESKAGGDSFRLMTIRSEGQFNTVVYEDHDLYRGVEGRNVILINPEDALRLGLPADSPVRVSGPAGTMEPIRLILFEDIRVGNAAMYFPESNVLLSRLVDPLSRTPAFKGARVMLTHLEKYR
jgi:molybdopterin-dependent oxidoreductase alpha subunit